MLICTQIPAPSASARLEILTSILKAGDLPVQVCNVQRVNVYACKRVCMHSARIEILTSILKAGDVPVQVCDVPHVNVYVCCVFACVYKYMCLYYIQTHTHTYIDTEIQRYSHTHVHTHAYMPTCIHRIVCSCLKHSWFWMVLADRICIHTHTQTCIHTWLHTYIGFSAAVWSTAGLGWF
jgi:hypothetical protein